MEQACCHKTKQRSEECVHKADSRLNRIEGQIRGMVEKSAYCPDILVQVAAANAALSAASTSSALNPPRWS